MPTRRQLESVPFIDWSTKVPVPGQPANDVVPADVPSPRFVDAVVPVGFVARDTEPHAASASTASIASALAVNHRRTRSLAPTEPFTLPARHEKMGQRGATPQ